MDSRQFDNLEIEKNMMEESYNLKTVSRDIVISEYNENWTKEFEEQGKVLREILGNEAIRIDHIGSTAVPGLPAKDVVDIQITVKDLDAMETFIKCMTKNSYRYREHNQNDNFLGSYDPACKYYRKRYFREAVGMKRTHIHVREAGTMNQRYALLFRDYLRNNPKVREAYGLIKKRLSEIFPKSIDGYLYIKDPIMDVIYAGAEIWGNQTKWIEDSAYL